MLNEKVSQLLNDQVNKEFYSAYLYLQFSNFYVEQGLAGKGAPDQQPGKKDAKGQAQGHRQGGDFQAQQHRLPFGFAQKHQRVVNP